MYLPHYERAFGSDFLKVSLPSNEERKKDREYMYSQSYRLRRTHWKALDNEQQRCDQNDAAGNTTKCITEYLERKIGCSMDLQDSSSVVPRFYPYFKCI